MKCFAALLNKLWRPPVGHSILVENRCLKSLCEVWCNSCSVVCHN